MPIFWVTIVAYNRRIEVLGDPKQNDLTLFEKNVKLIEGNTHTQEINVSQLPV
jgi:hypothetical protein